MLERILNETVLRNGAFKWWFGAVHPTLFLPSSIMGWYGKKALVRYEPLASAFQPPEQEEGTVLLRVSPVVHTGL